MRVLVACEYSGRVREAFRRRGHDAWSCDLLPAEDRSQYHIEGDALRAIERGCPSGGYWSKWQLMVAHPPCTHLAVSGARHFEEKRKDGRQQWAIDFFMALANAPIPRIAIENPVCIMSSVWREPDQTIQPWMFRARRNQGDVPMAQGPSAATADQDRERTPPARASDAARPGSMERAQPNL